MILSKYSINGQTLQHEDRVRGLRITMDPYLKFVTNTDAITYKAAAISWITRTSFSSRDQDVLKLAFCTYVRPILEYGSSVWNPHHKYLFGRIEKIQNKFTKSIHSHAKYSYKERLILLKHMTLEKCHLLADLTFCFKLLNGFAVNF